MHCPLKTHPIKANRGAAEISGPASELFIAYGAGALSPADELALRDHLQGCSDCRRVAEAQQEVWSALDAWTPAPLDANFDQRLYARIDAEQRKPWWSRTLSNLGGNLSLNWSWKPAMPVAAACAALLGAFLLKSPIAEHPFQASVQHTMESRAAGRVDIEQVERALDDMDMLKQLGVVSTQLPGAPTRPENL